jgi:hypothetical protein
MFQTKFVDKMKTQILRSIIFFSENRTVYEIMWKTLIQTNKQATNDSIMLRSKHAMWKSDN